MEKKGNKIKIIYICIAILLLVGLIWIFLPKSKEPMLPIVYNNTDGDLLIMSAYLKKEEDAIKLSNSDNVDHVKYANHTNRYLLFKKNDALYIYDSKKKDVTTKIVSNVSTYDFTSDDKYVVTTDQENNLYLYKVGSNKEKEKIDGNISSILEITEDKILYVKNDTIYIYDSNKKQESTKLTENANSSFLKQAKLIKEGKALLYINKENELIYLEYKKEKEEKIEEHVIGFTTNNDGSNIYIEVSKDSKNQLYYYDGTKSTKIEESIERLFIADPEEKIAIYSKGNNKKYTLYIAKKDKKSIEIENDLEYISLVKIHKEEIYYLNEKGDLHYTQIKGNKVTKPKVICNEVSVNVFLEHQEGFLFLNQVENGNGILNKVSKGKIKPIDTNVNASKVKVVEDFIYYLKEYNKTSGDLYRSNSHKNKKLESDIYTYTLNKTNNLYAIKGYSASSGSGDLYRITNKSQKIASNVKKIAKLRK